MTECFPSRRYQARRRAIFADEAHTPRVAEVTLQDRLIRVDAPPPAAREEERDVRVLDVDWDDQGGGGRVLERDSRGLAIEGPSATLAFTKHVARQQQSPGSSLGRAASTCGLQRPHVPRGVGAYGGAPEVRVLRPAEPGVICRALDLAAPSFDRDGGARPPWRATELRPGRSWRAPLRLLTRCRGTSAAGPRGGLRTRPRPSATARELGEQPWTR